MNMLAVVIPYYKITFFEETLKSLANQTNKQFEVYIGDDASDDDPTKLLQKFNNKLEFAYHRFEKNLGNSSLTKQWERCIDLTKEEDWLMLLCDDDYISPNFVEEFYRNLDKIEQLNINVVHFAVQRHFEDNSLSETFIHPAIENATDAFCRKYFGPSHGSLTEQIFRKKAYLKHKFRDLPLAWGSDDLAWLDFSDFGLIYGINKAQAYFRISAENISRAGYEGTIKIDTKIQLFKMLVEKDLAKFTPGQRADLLAHYERLVYRYHKVSWKFWSKQCGLLLKERQLAQIVRSGRKYIAYKMNYMFKSDDHLALIK